MLLIARRNETSSHLAINRIYYCKMINAKLEHELIFGAIDRENRWRRIAYITSAFGFFGCLLAGIVAVSVQQPAPELVPYDIRNGVVLQNVKVGSISTTQKEMIVESMIYSYVNDRETYDFFDNDIRIESVKSRSTSEALRSLIALWDSRSPDYLPSQYSNKDRIDVAVLGINLLPDNRAQIDIRKRLISVDGIKDGSFRVMMEYQLNPKRLDNLESVWKNPFGFVATNYRVVPLQYRQD